MTTPETYCPPEGQSGTGYMMCGGGVWAPAGPQVYPTKDGFELLVPTGNGQLDLTRNDFANTLMRLGPGLVFNPACDEQLCADFNPTAPSTACVESCRNLFIPRLMSTDPPLRPASGVCDDLSFLECYAALDYDLGANAPVKIALPEGPTVYVQPGKDGGVYLIDAKHMGILYDREQVVEICGAPGDTCKIPGAGMIVTQPAVTQVNGRPVVVIPTFTYDNTHPAGLVALKIVVKDSVPRFESFWQAPDFSTREAITRFRARPSRAVIAPFGEDGEDYAWTIEYMQGASGGGEGQVTWFRPFDAISRIWKAHTVKGTILEVRIKDGLSLSGSSWLVGECVMSALSYTTMGLDHGIGHPEGPVSSGKNAEVYGITKILRNQVFLEIAESGRRDDRGPTMYSMFPRDEGRHSDFGMTGWAVSMGLSSIPSMLKNRPSKAFFAVSICLNVCPPELSTGVSVWLGYSRADPSGTPLAPTELRPT